jgi:hypothetical protein
VPCRYGLVEPMVGYNPLRIELLQWHRLARDLLSARSLRAVVGYLTMPPGWSPHGNGATTEDMRARAAAQMHGEAAAPAKTQPGSETAPAGGFVATTL